MLASVATPLDNGLEVVVSALPHLHSVTVSLAVGCGSGHEGVGQWGLTHLLEHMLFRGSSRYPDAQALALAFERAGGTLEAETWRDHTYLSVSAHPSRLADVLTALADMVIAPCFTGLDIERNLVDAELQGELDARGRDIDLGNISRSQVWPHSPMGRRIIGSRQSLRGFSVTDLQRQHNLYYGANNAVLAIAGPVVEAEVRKLVAAHFGAMPAGERPAPRAPAKFAPVQAVSIHPHPGSQVALQLTFEALPDGHADFAAQTLLVNILDDGMSSRLPHALCAQRGLVYTLETGLDCYTDCGLYDIEMHVDPERAAEAVETTLADLTDVAMHGVTAEELAMACERAQHAVEFRADDPAEVAQHLAVTTLFRGRQGFIDERQRLAEVTLADVHRVARRLFAGAPPHATLLGPTQRADLQAIKSSLLAFTKLKD